MCFKKEWFRNNEAKFTWLRLKGQSNTHLYVAILTHSTVSWCDRSTATWWWYRHCQLLYRVDYQCTCNSMCCCTLLQYSYHTKICSSLIGYLHAPISSTYEEIQKIKNYCDNNRVLFWELRNRILGGKKNNVWVPTLSMPSCGICKQCMKNASYSVPWLVRICNYKLPV